MEAGRELDALVAEKVMGIKGHTYLSWQEGSVSPHGIATGQRKVSGGPKPYSTDVAAAFEVVAHVMKSYRSKISIETYDGEAWSIKPCGTSSKSLPHAICLAALKAASE